MYGLKMTDYTYMYVLRTSGRSVFEPSQAAEDAYCATVLAGSTRARRFYATCTPGYYNNEGAVDTETESLSGTFPGGMPGGGGTARFFSILHEQRANGACLDGLECV